MDNEDQTESIERGRYVVLSGLIMIVALTVSLAATTHSVSTPVTTYGRPAVVALAAILVWHGRLWARWLLVVLGFGLILAGPIALANGVEPTTPAGIASWTASVLYLASLGYLFRSSYAKAFFASRVSTGTSATSSTP